METLIRIASAAPNSMSRLKAIQQFPPRYKAEIVTRLPNAGHAGHQETTSTAHIALSGYLCKPHTSIIYNK